MPSRVLTQDDRSLPDAARPSAIPSGWALPAAWAAILLASDLDSILAAPAGLALPSWTPLVRAALLVVLALAVARSGRVPHARGFMMALAAMVAGDWLVIAVEAHLGWFTTATRSDRMLAGVFVSLIPAGFMGLTLVGSGISRRDLFLAWGELRARTSLPFIRGARWDVVAPALALMTASGLVLQLWIVSNASQRWAPAALVAALPAALLFATINACCEEFRFRCVLLARGVRAFGVTQAVASSSLLFGLAHYGGHPSGLSGVAMAGFLAWILARSMVDTRGWGWACLVHGVMDVIIFSMVRMTGV